MEVVDLPAFFTRLPRGWNHDETVGLWTARADVTRGLWKTLKGLRRGRFEACFYLWAGFDN